MGWKATASERRVIFVYRPINSTVSALFRNMCFAVWALYRPINVYVLVTNGDANRRHVNACVLSFGLHFYYILLTTNYLIKHGLLAFNLSLKSFSSFRIAFLFGL